MSEQRQAFVIYDVTNQKYVATDHVCGTYFWVEQLCCADFYVNRTMAAQELEKARIAEYLGVLEVRRVAVENPELPAAPGTERQGGRNMSESCKTCRFFRDCGNTEGFCRRRAPSDNPHSFRGTHPVVTSANWCGEYEPVPVAALAVPMCRCGHPQIAHWVPSKGVVEACQVCDCAQYQRQRRAVSSPEM